MSKRRVVFRADGNAEIGLGHLSRSLALAEMLSPEFACVFASVNPTKSALALIGNAFPVIALPELSLKEELGYLLAHVLEPTDAVVLDGYAFDLNYQQQIKAHGCRLVCIDDLNEQPFVADAVVNHAPGVKPARYQIQPHTKLCLGFGYAMLRAPFLEIARHFATGKPANMREEGHILVTFGGADKHNLALKIAQMCLGFPEVKKVSVVLGAGSQLPEFQQPETAATVHMHQNLTASQMCALMQRCAVLLAPASTVVMEGLATSLPVLCGYYVPAQMPPYRQLAQAGCITPVGDWNTITAQELQFAHANRPKTVPALIDGKQPDRLRELFRSLTHHTEKP